MSTEEELPQASASNQATCPDDMEQFLKSVEVKAFRMAQLATLNREDALDIVQDSMLKLVQKYQHLDAEQWPPLFYRILHNKIRDWRRRNKTRSGVMAWLFAKADRRHDEEIIGIDDFEDPQSSNPMHQLQEHKTLTKLEIALLALPEKQRQVFLLRAWQGFSVAETALAMGCSEGTIKTHYSRAVRRLKSELEGCWP